MSQSEPEGAEKSESDSDIVSQRYNQSESERAKVSRSDHRELGSKVPCSQLIMYDNEREIGSQSGKR